VKRGRPKSATPPTRRAYFRRRYLALKAGTWKPKVYGNATWQQLSSGRNA